MATDTRLGHRARRRCCEIVRARHAPCALCGYEIDQALRRTGSPHPLSSAVDEWLPRSLGGDPHDPDQCVEMHRVCNGMKSGSWPVTDELRRRCRAEVERIMHERDHDLEVRRAW